jgi:hypothetical protein
MREEEELPPDKLGETLYELGLLTANEYQFQRILNSKEFKAFEKRLKNKIILGV